MTWLRMKESRRLSPLFGLTLALLGCGSANLDAVPAAKAGCEAPDSAVSSPGSTMFPGRDCVQCHESGGQAGGELFAAAGTVFSNANMGMTCNTGGASGVTVDLLDPVSGSVLVSATTNSVGNFYFRGARPASGTAVVPRITSGSTVIKMSSSIQIPIGCASCHQPGGAAGDRIYL